MVADALIYHPAVSHYLKFVATTVGRDKVLRTLQYFARFYSWYLFRSNTPPASIQAWTSLKVQFGLIRKSMRLGKSVEHLRAASAAYDAHPTAAPSSTTSVVPGAGIGAVSESFLRYCTIGRQLGYAGYMFWDNLTFLDVAGIRRSADGGKEWQRRAYQAWMVGLLFSVVAGVYRSRVVLAEKSLGSGKEKEAEGRLERGRLDRERKAVDLQLISDLCDLTVPAFALGYGGGLLDDGIVGLAGTVSSLIGVVGQWQKTA